MIGYQSLQAVGARHPPPGVTAAAALVSAVILRGIMSSVKFRVGRRIRSSALVADAWNDAVDILSALAALTAVGLATYDPVRFLAADHYGGFVVGIVVVITGLRVSARRIARACRHHATVGTDRRDSEAGTVCRGGSGDRQSVRAKIGASVSRRPSHRSRSDAHGRRIPRDRGTRASDPEARVVVGGRRDGSCRTITGYRGADFFGEAPMIVVALGSTTDHRAGSPVTRSRRLWRRASLRWQTHVEHHPAVDCPSLQCLEHTIHILQGRAPDVRFDLPFGGECERLGQILPSYRASVGSKQSENELEYFSRRAIRHCRPYPIAIADGPLLT